MLGGVIGFVSSILHFMDPFNKASNILKMLILLGFLYCVVNSDTSKHKRGTRLTKLCKKLRQVLLKLSLKKFSLKTLFKVIYAILKQETFFLNSFTTNFGKINFYHKNNHAKINCFRWESNLSLLHRKQEQNQ